MEQKLGEIRDSVSKKSKTGNRYTLHKTDNLHTMLMLDTAKGEISIIQASLDDSEGIFFHSKSVLEFDSDNIGRFKLIRTKKMYQFILLDTEAGNVWRAQWGFKKDDNYLTQIK